MIETEFKASVGTYGNWRITACLGRRGVSVHRDTVRRLMRRCVLIAAQPRRKVRTATPAADLGARPDLVGCDFTAKTPGVKLVGDITSIRTWAEYVYLATVLDCATMKVVGYAMADHVCTSLVCEIVDMAVRNCPTVKDETMFHSDRVSQYTSEQFWHSTVSKPRWVVAGYTGTAPGRSRSMPHSRTRECTGWSTPPARKP